MNIKRALALTVVFCLAACVWPETATAAARMQQKQTVTVTEDFIKAVDAAAVELDGLRKIKKLTDQQIEQYKEKVGLLEQMQATQEKALATQEKAGTELQAALQDEKAAVAKCKEVVADYVKELDRVRKSRDRWRKLAFIGTAVGAVVGVVAGVVLAGK